MKRNVSELVGEYTMLKGEVRKLLRVKKIDLRQGEYASGRPRGGGQGGGGIATPEKKIPPFSYYLLLQLIRYHLHFVH